MNKKLILGTAALTTVVVGGYLYYRWVKTEPFDLFLEDEREEEEVQGDEERETVILRARVRLAPEQPVGSSDSAVT